MDVARTHELAIRRKIRPRYQKSAERDVIKEQKGGVCCVKKRFKDNERMGAVRGS